MDILREAGLNTLLGMGTTFFVLILLSLIIYLFGKIVRGAADRKKASDSERSAGGNKAGETATARGESFQNPIAGTSILSAAGPADMDRTLTGEGMAEAVASGSDYIPPEILAVISAAVAAAEGKAGVGGFEVRKIRKSRRHIA